jgi:hypothetical protein
MMDDNNDLQARLDRIGQWKIFDVDWTHFRELAALGIVDLCALSAGIHPEYARLVRGMTTIDRDEPLPENIAELAAYQNDNITEWERRVAVTVNHIKAGMLPVVRKSATFGGQDPYEVLPENAESIVVKVADFVAWAGGLGWSLPEEMTEPQSERKEITACDPQGVTVHLPHTNKTLDAVFKIMRDNWTDTDPKRLPKQVNIAREIDDAVGWNAQSNDEPSRNAKALAAAIKPDGDTE